MKSVSSTFRVLLGVVLVALPLSASLATPRADQPPAANGGSSGQMGQAEMQKMMELATPGPEHQALGKLVGDWKTSIKMWMGPGDPTVTEGKSTYAWILGGRYLESHHTGQMGGMPFEGMEIDGYDRAQKQYFSTWIDNMGTGMMNMTGQPATNGKGIDLAGSMFDPTQMKNVPVREEVRWSDDTDYVMSMYVQMSGPDGQNKEMKVMELTAHKI